MYETNNPSEYHYLDCRSTFWEIQAIEYFIFY